MVTRVNDRHTASGCHTHARTYNARQRDKSPDSPVTPCRMGGDINFVLQQQRMVRVRLPLGQLGLESSVTYYVCILSFLVGTPLPIPVFYVHVRGPWYFFTRLLHFTSSKSNRNKARSMPGELWVTITNVGGRAAEAAVAVKFLGYSTAKKPRINGQMRGGRGVVSDRAYNIWPFFTL